ncbi:hypothetical protein J2X26_004098 [Cellulomonas humilata]|uniref:Uncharacterized protein n=1 Tax=Cellulomonas humilata TaxID=144055 RepID=A0ABU0EL62_9CELL|nr:hypothetical protein [Cellulomonas humilata]MDQ0375760.1 hypothetical protein [Cellulomonas humilata]
MLGELLRDRRDRARGGADQRIAVARVADGRGEDVGQREGAVPREQVEPGAERPGDHRGEVPGAGDEVQAQVPVGVDGRGGGRGALPADHEGVPVVGAVADDRGVAAGAVQVWLDDAQREAGGHRGVERVAAGLQDPHPDRRREPVGGGDHAEGSDELGAGGEHLSILPHGTVRTPGERSVNSGRSAAYGR